MGNRIIIKSIVHLFLGALFIGSIAIIGCVSEESNTETMPTRDINAVMEAHTQELMAIEGVVGVAIGENDEKKSCIMVLILEENDEILKKIPKVLEGYPVCPFESGEIKPLSGN